MLFLITYIYLTASQMWLLSQYLPLMIGAEIPNDDEHWKSFTLLLQIMQYLFAPKLSVSYTTDGHPFWTTD